MTAPQDVDPVKAALRERVWARRRDRSPTERATASAAVATALLRQLARVRTLAAFVPDETEPGHGRLPAAFTQLGARVLLPVVPGGDPQLHWAVDTGRLAPGRFGLLEPVGPRLGPTAIGAAEVVVVPALAVDRAGTRLGRGGGYYDRALQHVRRDAVVVALVFDDELVDRLPALDHDRPVSAVVTPAGGWEALPAGR
ncbi:5-formyltetrahydrofolate cyclo-ligase [Geodermatophilus tzadiensis]|uniref:5-formyltetrahydrofolate cyclo-ligase n=1 Tax=Geodermatophilus tzadiensis TaxID=1137988 RepID=A0A2T0TUG9_9ACTN|nr:5-formyltetrahydrofolate cyclo-ligase [Geodermatophilus tzadiensis]PRY49307.1 5-formyltetrahydrofolate cyclo-ligase [Geodermatophilus tzadiensis]